MSKVIGIDIGGTHLRIGLVDESGSISGFRKVRTKEVLRSYSVLVDLAEFIESFSADFDAVSIGFPATLNRERTRVLQAPNLEYMENLPVVEYLSERLKVPVFAERDVTMTLCYDMRKYGIPPEGVITGIYFGTGIGNAIMIDGKHLTGRNGTAGELGHVPVHGHDEPCGCGLRGCAENLAGGKFLAKHYDADELPDVFVKHKDELEGFVSLMAECVAAEVNVLDPDYVILGGGVMNMKGFPREELHREIMSHVRRPYPAENLRIIYAEDEPHKSVAGAAYYALERMRGA